MLNRGGGGVGWIVNKPFHEIRVIVLGSDLIQFRLVSCKAVMLRLGRVCTSFRKLIPKIGGRPWPCQTLHIPTLAPGYCGMEGQC